MSIWRPGLHASTSVSLTVALLHVRSTRGKHSRPPPSPSPSSSVKAARQPGRPRQKPDSHANNYCARHKFVRPPPSCVPRRAPNRAATSLAPSAASRAASSASGSATVAHKAAGTAPLAGEGAPRLAVASGGRLSSLVAAAPHNQLIALGLVVALVGSGLFIARLCKYTPKMTGSRANQKKKDSALRKIVQAQEAASKGDEGASRPSGSGATARGASGSSSKNGAADSTADADVAVSRPTLARINTAVGESLAAAVELLPSPSCVASGSSIIWSGLERLSDVIGATHSRTRSGSTSAPASSKGKGRQTEQPDEAEPVGISSSLQMRRRSSSRAGTMTPPNADVSVRKGKNKKGKNASSALMSPTQSTHLPSTAISSPAISRRGSARTDPNFVSEQGAQREAVVQTVASSRSATLRGGIPPNTRQPHADETARTERGRVSSVPMRHMTEASVQTSPRLLPLPASPALAARDTSSSAAAMPVSERTLPSFDLHASFQAMPALPPGASSLGGLDTYSITRAAPYGRPASPPMSISLSRSPSAAASASSGSPNSRRASSPSIGPSPNSHVQPLPMTSDRRSSTVSVNGHLAVNTPERAASSGGSSPAASNSRSRKAVRKANGLDAGSSGVVGLPGAVAAPRRSGEADRKPDRGRSAGPKGAKSPKLEAASVALERRSSTASSVASAGSGSNALFAAHANSGTDPPPLPDWHRQQAAKLGHAPLGVDPRRDYDDARSEGGSDLGRRSSSVMGEGYVPPAEFDLRNGQGASPESSPHPSQRSLPSSHQPFGHPYAPWSPQLGPQQAATMASPSSTNASRPPSRGSSLSVPVAMTPLAASAAQQQQAFALAQAQLQTQTQLMQHYQQIAAMQLQQRQAQAHGVPTLRRRATSGALSETSDGLLSPVGTATPATPHGFNPPFASPTLGGSTGNAPTWSAPYSSQPSPQHIGPPSPYLGLSQTSSPTTVSFPPSSAIPQIPPQTVHSHPHANGSWPHVNGGPTGYLASPAMVYGQMQPSPSHAYFSHSQNPMPPAQQQRNNSMPYSPRPRLSSSVSTGGPSTGAGKGGTSGSTSTPSGKTRNGAERSHSIPSVPLSGGVPLGDAPPSGWKGKLKQAEQDADRMSKELEIARWRLVVVEEEQRAAEREVGAHSLDSDPMQDDLLTSLASPFAEPGGPQSPCRACHASRGAH